MKTSFHSVAGGARIASFFPSWSRCLSLLFVVTCSAYADSSKHTANSPTYVPGHTITIQAVIEFTGDAPALGYVVDLPPGWSFAGASTGAGDVGPAIGSTTRLEWAWTKKPASPVVFSYVVNVPNSANKTATINAQGLLRQNRKLKVIPSASLALKAQIGG